MRKINLFTMPSCYREPLEIPAYVFGEGEKTVAIVGPSRGDEIQQLYICSQIVHKLRQIEEAGDLMPGKSVQVIPCINPYSINIRKRFWAMDNTDINRMFPGYDKGETTQRIAGAVFEKLQGWKYGIQFPSFYLHGAFMSHVRIMKTDFTRPEEALPFGLPFIIVRKPMPIDTTTLNYNWQIWDTQAFSIYTRGKSSIEPYSARIGINAVLRFLAHHGVIRYNVHGGEISTFLTEKNLTTVHSGRAGIYRLFKQQGDQVRPGDLLGEVIDPYEGDVLEEVRAQKGGVIFFACHDPLVLEHQTLFEIVTGLHY